MEEFWKRYDAFASQLQTLAGAAWDNLVLYKQAESIGHLAVGFVTLIIGVGLIIFIAKKLAPNWTYNVVFAEPEAAYEDPQTQRRSDAHRMWDNRRERAQRNNGDANPLTIFGSIASAIAAFVLIVFYAGPELLYIWNWIGAFCPEARLFHDIFEALAPRVLPATPAA